MAQLPALLVPPRTSENHASIRQEVVVVVVVVVVVGPPYSSVWTGPCIGTLLTKAPRKNFVKYQLLVHPVIEIVQSLHPLHFGTDLDTLFAHEIGYFQVISRSYILGQSPVVTSGACPPL